MRVVAKILLLLATLSPFTVLWVFDFDPIALGITFLISVTALVIYIIHIVRNPDLTTENRALWIIGVVTFYGVAGIAYWIIYVLSGPENTIQTTS